MYSVYKTYINKDPKLGSIQCRNIIDVRGGYKLTYGAESELHGSLTQKNRFELLNVVSCYHPDGHESF